MALTFKADRFRKGQSRHFGCKSVTWFRPNSGHVAGQQQLTLCAAMGDIAGLA
jgi:hypothetical protein